MCLIKYISHIALAFAVSVSIENLQGNQDVKGQVSLFSCGFTSIAGVTGNEQQECTMFENLGVCVLHLKLTVTGGSSSDTDGICHVWEKEVDMGHVVRVNIILPYGETISHMLLNQIERCVFVFLYVQGK